MLEQVLSEEALDYTKSNRFVTGRLQKHVNQAVKEVDSEGLKALTQKQLRAVQKNSRLYPAQKFENIEFREYKPDAEVWSQSPPNHT